MAIIGKFFPENGGFSGYVRTLTLKAMVRFEPLEKTSEKQPDFRVVTDEAEIGAAWCRTATESGREYVSVQIDDPSFAQTINVNLVQTEDHEGEVFALIWSR